MQAKIVIVIVAVCLIPVFPTKTRQLSRLQKDALSKTRCDLMCHGAKKKAKSQCRSKCRIEQEKPGTCPATDSPKWAAACVETCKLDSQCDGTQRCCRHGCGSTCNEPVDLSTVPGLPAFPVVQEPVEKRRSILVRWTDGVGDEARAVPGRILYLLEEQHHLGPKYEVSRLGDWTLILRTNRSRVSLRNVFKPGRWYRFRVAAVSSDGTRGFSDPSPPFTPRRGPRPPPPPKKLKVWQIGGTNDSITVRLEWKEGRSDLPVLRYKVFWSRRVRGLGGELDSVLVNHMIVSKNEKSVEIKDLQPNSMYFLQVQAVSQFGLGKLRSDKASIFYNTTSGTAFVPQALKTHEKKITGLKLHKIVWSNNKIKAKISWDPLPNDGDKPRRYFVHWKTLNCENNQNQNKELSAVTEQTSFEIYELDYQCSYKVYIDRSWQAKYSDSELVVTIPECEYFKKKVTGSALIC